MQPDQILQSDLLDIIFEKRNKIYGAYTIRKFYRGRIYKALGIVFLFALIISSMTFLEKHQQQLKAYIFDEAGFAAVPELPKEKIVPLPKLKVLPPVKVNSTVFVSNVVITKNPIDATKLSKNLDSSAIAAVATPGPDPGSAFPPDPGPGSVKTIVATDVAKPVDKNTALEHVEVMPSFPGGIDALRKFLERNLQNPMQLDEGENVSVKIRFIVGFDGLLKGFETIEDGGAAFNDEVVRVLKKMPAWIPGKTKGENVSVYFTIPVKFTSVD